MRQRAVKQSSDINKKVADFGHGLHAFSQQLEQDIAELRRLVASKPQAGREFAVQGVVLLQDCAALRCLLHYLTWLEHRS